MWVTGSSLVQREKSVVVSYVLRIEQIHSDRLIASIGAAASRNLPVTSEPDIVLSCLPGDDIVDLVSASKHRRSCGRSNVEIGYIDRRCADSETAGAIRILWNLFIRTYKEIREAQVIDPVGTEK